MHGLLMVFVPTPMNPVDVISNIDGLGGKVAAVITLALPYAVGLFAAILGWRYVRKFIH